MGIKQKQMIVSQRSPNPPRRSGIREQCGADPEVGARGRRSIEEGSDNGKPDAGKLPSFFEALRRSASFAQNAFTNGPS
jgi:hypothetical protein